VVSREIVDMTGGPVETTRPVVSDVVAARVRDLRKRARVSQKTLAAWARDLGAPSSFTATVVGFLETGRTRDGRRTRDFTIDEVLWLAAALKVSPLELLGDSMPSGRARRSGFARALEQTLASDLGELALTGLDPSLATMAIRLARAIDQASPDQLPRLTRELRATIEQISAGRRGSADPDDEDDGDDLDGLDEPEDGDTGEVDLSGIDVTALDDLGP
jgi:transcriptional regulator with XRE-family HTH domain